MPAASTNLKFRDLPSVDELLRHEVGLRAAIELGPYAAAEAARRVVAALRAEIAAGGNAGMTKQQMLDTASSILAQGIDDDVHSGIRRVINATGVVIHTNLGRAPLSAAARKAASEAAGYSTVEYDANAGARGRRGRRAERLAAELSGAEDAVIVNNCAAAAFFVLSAFARGGEVIVSRGELVEIGGDFRIPDVLTASGAALREVGTTNRTKTADYERAISAETKMLLRVHPSNYRIVGFTAKPSLTELSELAKRHGLLFYEDIGSGSLIADAVTGEPAVLDSIKAGADIVTFSGDKLLGGPQAGIIAGRAELIERLRKHPMYRILRADKITYAGLEATLDAYRKQAPAEIPVQRMLALTAEEIGTRARALCSKLSPATEKAVLTVKIAAGNSAVGGGAAPGVELPTTLMLLSHASMTPAKLEYKLRTASTPVITRIVEDAVAIDLRTVDQADEDELLGVLLSL